MTKLPVKNEKIKAEFSKIKFNSVYYHTHKPCNNSAIKGENFFN